MNVGIISGHLIPDLLHDEEQVSVETPYGAVTVTISSAQGHTLFFVNRHGQQGTQPPHRINSRATIAALAASHVTSILSLATVGSMNPAMAPGDIVIPTDFIDMTKGRPVTFFDDARVHVDMTDPFCPSLRSALLSACSTVKGLTCHGRGVCLVTEGPRLETAAEIRFFSQHADVVGMTMVPEVVLAREKGLCYASLCLVCNKAAGMQDRLTTDEILAVYRQRQPQLAAVLSAALTRLEDGAPCPCPRDLSKARL
jgi:5'-methylthioadenosine phosphorylase